MVKDNSYIYIPSFFVGARELRIVFDGEIFYIQDANTMQKYKHTNFKSKEEIDEYFGYKMSDTYDKKENSNE